MKGDNVVSGLVRRRRALNRAIREHEAAIERLRHGGAIIDQALLLWSETDPKRQRGVDAPASLSRCILTALRLSEEPLGISELTRRVMLARGQVGRLADRTPHVRKAVNRLEARGLVASRANGTRLQWEVVR